MSEFAGKIAVVTGGAGGLGFAIAKRLQAGGAEAVVVDSRQEGLDTVAVAGFRTYLCDVTDETQVTDTLARIATECGKVAILVNNVGILYSAPLLSIGKGGVTLHDSGMWHKVLATNLSSAFYVGKHVAAAMIKTRTKGVIVNMSSVSARGNAGQSAYAAAKAGLEALTKVWAKELGPLGIRCFAVAPGFCETPSTRAAMPEAALKDVIGRVPLRRLGTPDEIADIVAAGAANNFLTGKVLEIDGGLAF